MKVVGIFVFNEVEVLDFAGPFEVFSITEVDRVKGFEVHIIGERQGIISARNGLKVQVDYTFSECPDLDILIVPGGYGAEHIEINKPQVLEWIKNQNSKVEIVASVCTGAFLLAQSGILDYKKATTHWMDIERLVEEYPLIDVRENVKYVDEGRVLTSAGISAGIVMSLYLVKRIYTEEVALNTARKMEYDIIPEDISKNVSNIQTNENEL